MKMNPASQEYIHTHETLKEELAVYKTQQGTMRLQIAKLLDENKRLFGELRDKAHREELLSTESGLGDVERRLSAAIAAKNAAVEMWQLALGHLEEQEQQLIGKRSLVEVERGESAKVVEKVKEEYVRGLNVLSTEVTNYRKELSIATQELRSKTTDLEKFRADLEVALRENTESKKAVEEMGKIKEGLEGTVESLRALLSETESFLTSTKEEMVALKAKNGELSSLVSDLKEQNKNLRTQISTFEKDAKDSLLTAQEAILRRKEMAYREEQYLKDIDHLKSAVNLEAEKLNFRHKAEIKKIQNISAEKVRSLMEEIQSLHQENSDKQSLFERASREKQALENKLEMLYSECSNRGNYKLSEELCSRLTTAEKSLEEYEFRVRSLETELDEVKNAKEQELCCAKEEQELVIERLRKVEGDFSQSASERLELCGEVTKLKKAIYALEKELKQTREKDADEISSLREGARKTQESLMQRLQSNDERYKSVCGELQRLLDAELGISGQWKEVVEDLVGKSEAKIKELCQTIVQLQDQNKVLSNGIMQDNIYLSNYAVTMDR